MSISRMLRVAALLLVCGLAVLATLVPAAGGGSTAAATPTSQVIGTASTRLVFDRFKAVGRRVVGQGTVISKWHRVGGRVITKRKHFRLTIRGTRARSEQEICNILFLQLGELDLTLAGLHVVLHAFDPTQPVELRLTADRDGGVLGRLFCDLAEAGGFMPTFHKAKSIAQQLNHKLHLHRTVFMRVSATVYGPGHGAAGATGLTSPQGVLQLTDECPVLHLVLGPLHLELLGLIVDLNKVVLDLTAIPGTILGDVFCQLAPPPPPPPAPPGAHI